MCVVGDELCVSCCVVAGIGIATTLVVGTTTTWMVLIVLFCDGSVLSALLMK